MNSNCCLQLIINEAHFLKDSDLIGKQDPFIQFTYDSQNFRTEVKEDAGLDAKFGDVFMLENVEYHIFEGAKVVLNAYDKDVVSSDLLGVGNAIDLVDFC